MNKVTLAIKENAVGKLILVPTTAVTPVLNQLYTLENELEANSISTLLKVTTEATPETGVILQTLTGDVVLNNELFHEAVLAPVRIIAKEV